METGRELYGTYNQILAGLVSMINNPSPWKSQTLTPLPYLPPLPQLPSSPRHTHPTTFTI